MSYSRRQWAVSFLNSIGNSHPTDNVVNWVVVWTQFETAAGKGASYNLLNTTQREPGSSPFNSIGVQNFTSYDQGIQANADTLRNGLYSSLLDALRTNNEQALGFSRSSPSQGVLDNLHTWCGSCAYGGSFATSTARILDLFPGVPGSGAGSPTGGGTSGGGSGSNPTSSGGSTPSTGSSILTALGLPSPADAQRAFTTIGLFMFGAILLLVGVLIMFFQEQSKGAA